MCTDRTWKPFIVPQNLLRSDVKWSSPLLSLPTEILIEVFSHARMLDQLALALACKRLLQVSSCIRLKISSLTGQPVSRHSGTMEKLLRFVRPVDARGRPKRGWSVCVDCLQYRPMRKSYWKKKRPSKWSPEAWDNIIVLDPRILRDDPREASSSRARPSRPNLPGRPHSSPSPPLDVQNATPALLGSDKPSLPALNTHGLSALNSYGQTSLSNPAAPPSPAPNLLASAIPSMQQGCTPAWQVGNEVPPAPSSSVMGLVNALDEESARIIEFFSQSVVEAIGDAPRQVVDDPRIADLQDRGRSTLTAKFRKCLSQRTVAIEYIQWELHVYGSSRVRKVVGYLLNDQKPGNGHVKEYLERCYDDEHYPLRMSMITYGIKMLVFEQLVGAKPISAILCFKYNLFRMVKFEELDLLKEIFKSREWVMELLGQKIDWFQACQNQYDDTPARLPPLEENQSHVPEQLPPIRSLIDIDPATYGGYNIKPDGRYGPKYDYCW
ncbi:MAG: hypothetical protein Q9163_001738 [Psora crenata]